VRVPHPEWTQCFGYQSYHKPPTAKSQTIHESSYTYWFAFHCAKGTADKSDYGVFVSVSALSYGGGGCASGIVLAALDLVRPWEGIVLVIEVN